MHVQSFYKYFFVPLWRFGLKAYRGKHLSRNLIEQFNLLFVVVTVLSHELRLIHPVLSSYRHDAANSY